MSSDKIANETHPTDEKRRHASGGFTLIEIMAVVVIMGMLMGLVGVGVFAQVDKARRTTAKAQISQIESALEFYRMDNSKYPTALEGLIKQPSDAKTFPRGGYLRKASALKDPWDQPYNYQNPGTKNPHGVDLSTAGPDGIAGNDDDVNNWVDGGSGQ